MVALKTERRVFMWRVQASVRPSNALESGRSATLDEIVGILEAESLAGRARVYLKGGSKILDDGDPDLDEKNQLFIAAIKRDPATNSISLLISRGDPNAADPSFVDAGANTVRVERPTGVETPGWSAHLVISTVSEARGHRACFEQMAHVSSGIVLAGLDRIITRALVGNPTYRFDVIRKVGGKTVVVWNDYRPVLFVERVPSERLLDDLETGSLSGITLKKSLTYYAGVGVADIVKSQEERIFISLRKSTKEQIQDFLPGLLNKAKSEHFDAVTFHVDDLPGNQTSQPTLTLGDADALEQLYVRAKRLVDFDVVLEQCYSTVCVAIEQKMVSLLRDDGSW